MSSGPWFIPHATEPTPDGPYEEDEILAFLRKGRIKGSTLCWCEGMPRWRPLRKVPPFAAACPPLFPTSRVVAVVSLIVVLTAAVWFSWNSFVGWYGLRRATQLRAAGAPAEAATVLAELAQRYPLREDLTALLASTRLEVWVQQPPEAPEPGRVAALLAGQGSPLAEVRNLYRRLLAQRAADRPRIATEVTTALAGVPGGREHACRRAALLQLAEELEVVDRRYVAGQAFQQFQEFLTSRGLSTGLEELGLQVLRRDPGLATGLIVLTLPPGADERRLPAALGFLSRLLAAAEQPPELLPTQVFEMARRLAADGEQRGAERVLASTVAFWPDRGPAVDQFLLELLTKRLEAGMAADVLRTLTSHFAPDTPAAPAAAQFAITVARRVEPTDRAAAEQALGAALRLDPQVLAVPDDLMLAIRITAQPTDQKLARCQRLLRDFPESIHRHPVRLLLVQDAARRAGQGRDQAGPYLDAGRQAADVLLENYSQTSLLIGGLDDAVLALARALAAADQRPAAIALLQQLLLVAPQTKLQDAVQEALTAWLPPAPPKLTVEERRRQVEAKLATLLEERLAKAQPKPEDVAAELGLPWPVHGPTLTPAEVDAKIGQEVQTELRRRFPADPITAFTKEESTRLGAYSLGDKVDLVLAIQGPRQRITGVIREIGNTRIMIGDQFINPEDLDEMDRARLYAGPRVTYLEERVKERMKNFERAQQAFRDDQHKTMANKYYREAGYVSAGAGWAAPTKLIEARQEAIRTETGLGLRRALEDELYPPAGFVRQGEAWVSKDGQ